MMPPERGRAVISLSGRDKGRYMAVTCAAGGFLFVADGRVRKLAHPKRKNEKHLAFTNTVFDEAAFENDKRLREAILKRFGAEGRHG